MTSHPAGCCLCSNPTNPSVFPHLHCCTALFLCTVLYCTGEIKLFPSHALERNLSDKQTPEYHLCRGTARNQTWVPRVSACREAGKKFGWVLLSQQRTHQVTTEDHRLSKPNPIKYGNYLATLLKTVLQRREQLENQHWRFKSRPRWSFVGTVGLDINPIK